MRACPPEWKWLFATLQRYNVKHKHNQGKRVANGIVVKRAEMLRHPGILGGPQTTGDKWVSSTARRSNSCTARELRAHCARGTPKGRGTQEKRANTRACEPQNDQETACRDAWSIEQQARCATFCPGAARPAVRCPAAGEGPPRPPATLSCKADPSDYPAGLSLP